MTPVDGTPVRGRRLSWPGLAAAAALVFGVALGGTVLVGAALRPDPVPAPAVAAAPATTAPSAGLPVVAPDVSASSAPPPTTTSSATRTSPSSPDTDAPAPDRGRSGGGSADSHGDDGAGHSPASRLGDRIRDRILSRLGDDG